MNMPWKLGPSDQPWLERTFRLIVLVASAYVACIVVLFARGDGIAAAYLTMPASILVLWLLDAAAGVASGLVSSQVVQLLAVAASAIVNAVCTFGIARLLVARW